MTWHLLFVYSFLLLSLSLPSANRHNATFFSRILYSRFWFTFTSHHHWRGPPTHFSSLDEIRLSFIILSFFFLPSEELFVKHDVSKETKTRQKSRAYEDSQSAINWWKQVRIRDSQVIRRSLLTEFFAYRSMRIVPASKFPAKLPINDDDTFNFRTAAPFPRENRRRVGKKKKRKKEKISKISSHPTIPNY